MLATKTKEDSADCKYSAKPGIRVPLVIPAKSDGREIEGDFSLDPSVIDRTLFCLRRLILSVLKV